MISYVRKKCYGFAIELEKVPDNFQEVLKEHLKKYNIHAIESEMPLEINFTDKIGLDVNLKKVPKLFISSGAYRVYFDNDIIYIGSSDSDGNIPGRRKGMWGRRADWKSTLLGCNRYKCASSEITKHFYEGKDFPIGDLKRIQHEFFACHPYVARDVEFKLQKEYKDIHGDLPIFNRLDKYTGGARKIT